MHKGSTKLTESANIRKAMAKHFVFYSYCSGFPFTSYF